MTLCGFSADPVKTCSLFLEIICYKLNLYINSVMMEYTNITTCWNNDTKRISTKTIITIATTEKIMASMVFGIVY